MNKEISNTMIEVEEGIELNDKDYISDLLATLKAMVKDYTVALTEVSNEELFSKYKEMYDKLLNLQRETFEVMFRCGFYKFFIYYNVLNISNKHNLSKKHLSKNLSVN